MIDESVSHACGRLIFVFIRVLFCYTDKCAELCTVTLNRIAMNEHNEIKPKYVDILSLGGFNAFFGDENNKSAVMTIINELLPKHRRVVDIEYMPTEHPGPVIGYSKDFRYDFMCRDASGAVFIVELQKYYEAGWFKRCVSYAGRAYERQNKKGVDYDAIQPVYLIGLMGVSIDHPDKEFWKNRYVSEYTFYEKESHDLLDETIVIIFAELVNFNKTEDECVTRQDRMLYILKNSGKLLVPPSWSEQERYDEILKACDIDDFSKEKLEKYNETMQDEKRLRGQMAAARNEGREEGREEGEKLKALEIAKNMLSMSIDVETIARATGLSVEEVEAL